ncbi:unnamed protein product [Lupinus luteus]|uniref:Pollen Ole e 1 allergen and extensin family protein n=1 Tax=Lupinus luteus TaxID=3873 RepID=A0AAV1YM25_LUPLU
MCDYIFTKKHTKLDYSAYSSSAFQPLSLCNKTGFDSGILVTVDSVVIAHSINPVAEEKGSIFWFFISFSTMETNWHKKMAMYLILLFFAFDGSSAWTGEIHGRVFCDVCADSSVGPEDHVLHGAEVAVLCTTKSGEVLNYQAFTDSKGIYSVAETMPESDRWDACLARPVGSFHEHCTRLGGGSLGVKFSYNRPSGYSHTVRTFVYRPANIPSYCI